MDRAVIRRAEPADLSVVRSIMSLAPEASQWSDAALDSFLRMGGEIFLTVKNGTVAGFLASRQAADELEILNLAVRPEFRRQGLARLLVDAALLDAKGRGAEWAHLEVRSSNQAAMSFYAACGFLASGQRKNYYAECGEDAVLMKRKMESS